MALSDAALDKVAHGHLEGRTETLQAESCEQEISHWQGAAQSSF